MMQFMSTFDCLYSLNLCLMAWGVLCWEDRLTADVLRHSPLFWKGCSQAQSSFQLSRRSWRRWGTWRKEIDPPGFVTWVKCIVVSGCVGRLSAVEGTHVHWGRRYWGRFWRLRWFRAIIVIVGIFGVVCYCHRCQDVKRIGRQVQVVQARGNNWKLPSKIIWHCGLIWVVIDCHNLWFRWCNWW